MDNNDAGQLKLTASAGFSDWLESQRISLAISTYQAAKIFLVGNNSETGRISVFERTFARAMGLAASPDARQLWLASQFQLWRFEDFLSQEEHKEPYDAVYVPIEGRTVGEVDIHDIHPRPDQPPLFVVSRFNCIATLDAENSFKPLWMPKFIDVVVAEDRCHLNGMATRNDVPKLVTCVAATNSGGEWRSHRRDGGIVIDVESNEIVASGFSMPHSPRLVGDHCYMIQSGTGEFGTLDLASGQFTSICSLQGFARGLSILGDFAIIGVSKPRDERHFGGLALSDTLAQSGLEPMCHVAIVNLKTGAIEHSLLFEGVVSELYDVAILHDIKRPMIHGFVQPDLRFVIRPAPFDLDAHDGKSG
ncbi:TIGR03032 family protein [uncultured Roseibium sp.]|uniref:TIGR03032 family protein n=1 Tax=uncultured Roseibium sp. TaxID=1936171 RepID=UPI0026324B9A|nr:TIGR03032 family protein [uncultured Roseibium sp.]